LDGRVGHGEHQPTLAEGFRYRHRHEKADQEQAHGRPFGIEPVGNPGRVDPRPPHRHQQQQRPQRTAHRQVVQQPVGELRDGEDEAQVEEQL